MERHSQTHRLTWQGIALLVAYNPASFGSGNYAVAHLEVRTITPEGVRLPITETGYRSHHLSPVYVDQAGGPVAYAVAWLDAEARKPEWRRYVEASRQLSLF